MNTCSSLSKKKIGAFTMMELILVIMIISALAGTALVQLNERIQITRSERARINVITIHSAIVAYIMQTGSPPPNPLNGLAAINAELNLNLLDNYFIYKYDPMIWQVEAEYGNPLTTGYEWIATSVAITDNPAGPNPLCTPGNRCP